MFRRDAENALGEYWNGLSGAAGSSTPSVGADLAETLNRLYLMDDAPVPAPEFVDRLRLQFSAQTSSSSTITAALESLDEFPKLHTPSVGRDRRAWSDRQGPRLRGYFAPGARWLAAQAALALLLIFVAGSVAVIFFVQRDSPEPTPIPAVVPDEDHATPQDRVGVDVEQVVDLVIDPADLGIDRLSDWNVALFESAFFEAGKEFVLCPNDSCGSGLTVMYVADGQMTVTLSGPAILFRSQVQEPLSPETEAKLGPGDAIAFNATSLDSARNSGPDRLLLLTYYTGEAADPTVLALRNVDFPDNDAVFAGRRGSTSDLDLTQQFLGSVAFTIEQIDLEAGARFPIESRANETLMIVTPAESLPGLALASDGQTPMAGLYSTVLHDFPPGSYSLQSPPDRSLGIYVAHLRSA